MSKTVSVPNIAPSSDIVEQVLLATSTIACCLVCGAEEFVIALDDKPLDVAFTANYVCEECESAESSPL